MKILCVIDSLGSGGAQQQLVNLAIGFKERGHEISFMVYHQENFHKQVLDENSIIVHEVLESNYLKRLLKMRNYIRKGNFDSVLSFLEATNFICEISGLPWRKWKLVVGERSSNPNIYKSLKLRTYRWFHLLADSVVSNSNENMKIVRKINPLLPSKKCHVIYNIVDFEKWQLDKAYSFKKNGKLNIIVVASHQHLKNLNGLIEAIALLSTEEKFQLNIDWYGDLSSDNSKDIAIQKIARYGLGNLFHFSSPTPFIDLYVKNSDVLGLFSFYEGLPNVVCEAMACGKVILASNVSDIPNLLDDGRFTFDPKSVNSILQSIRFVLSMHSSDFLAISNKNLNRAHQLFRNKEILDSYLNLLN